MSVYPFYIEAIADGRKTPIAGGTRRKEGKILTKIHQRENGEITTPYEIHQYPFIHEDGSIELVTKVYFQGEVIHTHITDYWYKHSFTQSCR